MTTPEDIEVDIPVDGEVITELRQLKPGDQLAVTGEVGGIMYYHHGIYLGPEKGVVDFGGENKLSASVRKVDILKFIGNGQRTLIRIKYDDKNCLPVEEVIRRAEEIAQKPYKWEGYSVLTNNCEHFATWCKTGISKSKQVGRKILEFLKNPKALAHLSSTASESCFSGFSSRN